jgi:tRNA C32,U32 (ribose-2'-O)-methylase TrmJ
MATVGFLLDKIMNRQQRRALEKQTNKQTSEAIDLLLSVPEQCLTCHKKFDKNSKEAAMTWFVEVFKQQKKVILFCPECQQERIK